MFKKINKKDCAAFLISFIFSLAVFLSLFVIMTPNNLSVQKVQNLSSERGIISLKNNNFYIYYSVYICYYEKRIIISQLKSSQAEFYNESASFKISTNRATASRLLISCGCDYNDISALSNGDGDAAASVAKIFLKYPEKNIKLLKETADCEFNYNADVSNFNEYKIEKG